MQENISKFDNILYLILNEKINEKNILDLKSYFLFFSNCFNLELVDLKTIMKILLTYQLKLMTLIEFENKKNECEIINELLCIFTKNSKDKFIEKININLTDKNDNCENNNLLFTNIYKISNYKHYDCKSLSNKIIFKNKDIVDLFTQS